MRRGPKSGYAEPQHLKVKHKRVCGKVAGSMERTHRDNDTLGDRCGVCNTGAEDLTY